MSRLFAFTLGTLTAIGGFLDIGDLVADAQVGARFGLRLVWVTVIATIGIVCFSEMAARIGSMRIAPPSNMLPVMTTSKDRLSNSSWRITAFAISPSSVPAQAIRSRATWSPSAAT